jgi:hypothetical protein
VGQLPWSSVISVELGASALQLAAVICRFVPEIGEQQQQFI